MEESEIQWNKKDGIFPYSVFLTFNKVLVYATTTPPPLSPSSPSKLAYLEGPTKQDRPWAYRQKFTVLIGQIGIYQTFSFNL